MMTPRIMSPWTPGQVESLNRWQMGMGSHPFTCGNDKKHVESHMVLVATEEGWVCPVNDCGYTQAWAFTYMAMSDHMVNWGVGCESCARLLDSCYDETMRAERAEARVAELEETIRKIKESNGVYDG